MAFRQPPIAIILLALVVLINSVEGSPSFGPCSYKKCQNNEGCFVKNNVALCVKKKCLLPKERGPCNGWIPRYYFNKDKGHCELFEWGGCKGNANRFIDLHWCEKACGQPKVYGDCVKPEDTGSCNKKAPMFYFNHVNGTCETFQYGGCMNSNNKFQNLKFCQAFCAPKDYGGDKHCSNRHKNCAKWAEGGECEKNPWYMLFNCRKACKQCFHRYFRQHRCSYRPQQGPCDRKMKRFYYDIKSGKCHPFTYGGCRGNINSFASVSDCQNVCGPTPPPPGGNKCIFAKDRGPCNARLPRFYFNAKSGKCLKFSYGGCKGNANNFIDKIWCEKACKKANPGQPTVCELHSVAGPCGKKLTRFYFNKISQKCETFVWSGCGGNLNNFQDLHWCKKICGKHPPLPCTDNNKFCRFWALKGECRKNPGWMLANCRISCNVCRPS